MTEPDHPTPDDLRRLRKARLVARAEVAAARRDYMAARRAAFAQEIAVSIRSVSPFLITLLLAEELDIADVIRRIEPTPDWPRRSRPSRLRHHGLNDKHAFRHVAKPASLGSRPNNGGTGTGILVPLDDGGSAHIWVIGHSVEISLAVRDLVFETRFGELHITTSRALLPAVSAAAIGRLVDEVVSHPASDGWGWRVRSAKTCDATTVLVVSTGVVPWGIG